MVMDATNNISGKEVMGTGEDDWSDDTIFLEGRETEGGKPQLSEYAETKNILILEYQYVSVVLNIIQN
jgi:hypothetical protein